jgi:NADH-quinone oxidoreductase subunit E
LEYTLETVNCLGACDLGPVLIADGEYIRQMTVSKVDRLLKRMR